VWLAVQSLWNSSTAAARLPKHRRNTFQQCNVQSGPAKSRKPGIGLTLTVSAASDLRLTVPADTAEQGWAKELATEQGRGLHQLERTNQLPKARAALQHVPSNAG
jgi:hypothetical protein